MPIDGRDASGVGCLPGAVLMIEPRKSKEMSWLSSLLHWTDRESEVENEVDRLIALGAQRVDWVYPEGADFVVLSDTEGNLVCVIA
jgi:hypothetical protein